MKQRCKHFIWIAVLSATAFCGAIAAFSSISRATGSCISACTCDLDRDGTEEEILITRNPWKYNMEELLVRSGKDSSIIQRYSLKGLKAWKVQTADVDGDGQMEISVGVYKTARFHPVPAKRPFIYNWSRDGISPKWLGSRLSKPFEDYVFADIDADGLDELISIELLPDGLKVVNAYKWKGFGFEGIGESSAFQDVTGLVKGQFIEGIGFEIVAGVTVGKNCEQASFHYEDGMLVKDRIHQEK